jgi:hypothetical protein
MRRAAAEVAGRTSGVSAGQLRQQRRLQNGSVRFAALAEKGAGVASERLDSHFIDQFGEWPDI